MFLLNDSHLGLWWHMCNTAAGGGVVSIAAATRRCRTSKIKAALPPGRGRKLGTPPHHTFLHILQYLGPTSFALYFERRKKATKAAQQHKNVYGKWAEAAGCVCGDLEELTKCTQAPCRSC
jgi:hypothetical protein